MVQSETISITADGENGDGEVPKFPMLQEILNRLKGRIGMFGVLKKR